MKAAMHYRRQQENAMSIKEKYIEIARRRDEAALRSGRQPADVTLMAVTKTHTPDEINQAIDAGATDIGENRVQELLEKYDVRYVFVGSAEKSAYNIQDRKFEKNLTKVYDSGKCVIYQVD